MSTIAYIDTSAFLKLFLEEGQSAAVAAARQPGLRTLDALHVGAARVMQKDLPHVRVEMLACDQRLLRAAAALGMGTPIPPADPGR